MIGSIFNKKPVTFTQALFAFADSHYFQHAFTFGNQTSDPPPGHWRTSEKTYPFFSQQMKEILRRQVVERKLVSQQEIDSELNTALATWSSKPPKNSLEAIQTLLGIAAAASPAIALSLQAALTSKTFQKLPQQEKTGLFVMIACHIAHWISEHHQSKPCTQQEQQAILAIVDNHLNAGIDDTSAKIYMECIRVAFPEQLAAYTHKLEPYIVEASLDAPSQG